MRKREGGGKERRGEERNKKVFLGGKRGFGEVGEEGGRKKEKGKG